MNTDFNSTPLDSEDTVNSELPEQLAEGASTDDAGTVIEPTLPPVEPDPLEGFDPKDYVEGVAGAARLFILDLYLGYLIRNRIDIKYDKVQLRCVLMSWDRKNVPPLGFKAIKEYIDRNHARWLRREHLRNYPPKN